MQLSNIFVILFVVGTVVEFVVDYSLEFLDYKHRKLKGRNIPTELTEYITAEDLDKTCKYEDAKYKSYLVQFPIKTFFSAALLLFGFYAFVYNAAWSWTSSTFWAFFLFQVITSVPSNILSIPFDLYDEFKIEKKFGFSTMTFKLWLLDEIKSFAIGLIVALPLLFAICFLLQKATSWWWILLSVVVIIFSLIISIVYPMFIAPLFNKFSPLEEGELKTRLESLLQKCGFKSSGLYVMDASKRSKHSNAYFTGFGKSKRVVLYDTLINQLTPEEIEAVLGHELGHYKHRHIVKRLFVVCPVIVLVFFLVNLFINTPSLYNGFGFTVSSEIPLNLLPVGLLLLMSIFNGFMTFLSPITNHFSRKDEFEADKFSQNLCGTYKPLASALIKLNKENLSEITVPKIYSVFNYSHPPLLERIQAMKNRD